MIDAKGRAASVVFESVTKDYGAVTAVDAITFTAGVGENSLHVRQDSLAGLEGFGISVDPTRNAARSREPRYISPDGAPVAVLVVPTNEELAIARKALTAIGK